MLPLIIVSTVCALISSYVANEKGRHWLIWLIVGLLGGPIGLLVILLWPKDQKVWIRKLYITVNLKNVPPVPS